MSRLVVKSFTWRSLRLRAIRPYAGQHCRSYAPSSESSPPAPPLLLKLRNDLKTAMREKDKDRLNVLRGLLADVTNASKGPSAIKTDMQLLGLLRKRSAAAKSASEEFKGAGRQDLVDNEERQASILDEYAGSVQVMKEDDIREAVSATVRKAISANGDKVPMGEVMKTLLGPGGLLEGKPVEKAQVSKFVKEAMGS